MLHADPLSAASARAVDADAYTVGGEIVFGEGRYAPGDEQGERLLAHELVHVLQQPAVGVVARDRPLMLDSPDTAAEAEASQVADRMAGGRWAGRGRRPSTLPIAPPRREAGSTGVRVARQRSTGASPSQQASQQAQQAQQQAQQAQQQAQQAQQQAQQAQQQSQSAEARANAAMDEAKLASLRSVAVGFIAMADTAYVSACRAVGDSIKAAAKQQAEMMALVLDVAMGFATPVLSRWIVKWADRIPVEASTATYRVAMASLDNDRVKAMLTGATKVAGQELKSHSMQLAGETDVDRFISSLETHAGVSFAAVMKGLLTKNAAEVGVVTAAFDPAVVNRDTYTVEIKRLTDMFQREVEPIGYKSAWDQSDNLAPEVVRVKDGASQRLALVTFHPGLFGWGDRYYLDSWIEPDVAELAVQKQYATFGRLDTIDKGDLHEIHS